MLGLMVTAFINSRRPIQCPIRRLICVPRSLCKFKDSINIDVPTKFHNDAMMFNYQYGAFETPDHTIICFIGNRNGPLLAIIIMMTSSNGNIFGVTGPLCGEFIDHGEFPSKSPVTRSFGVFFDLRLNKRLSKHAGDLRHHHAHYDVTVMWFSGLPWWKSRWCSFVFWRPTELKRRTRHPSHYRPRRTVWRDQKRAYIFVWWREMRKHGQA